MEKTARRGGLRGENLRLAREHGSRPVLDRLHQYLTKIQVEVLPKSAAGPAVAYALKNWKALTRYCDDGDLSIDNNATERTLRGVAVGRNNWTFFGSDNGGKTAAVLRSFITSCELVKIDPFVWFRDVIIRIPDHPVNKLDNLLPIIGRQPKVKLRQILRVESRMGASADAGSAAPFPIPAHQTGRAQLRHPAFRLASPQTHKLGFTLAWLSVSTPSSPNTAWILKRWVPRECT